MHTIHTIPEADAFFASLPEGFDTPQDFAAALTPAGSEAPVGYIPVAGTAGRTAAAALTAGILTAAGFRTGLYRAGAGPLSGRVTVDGQPLSGHPAAAAAYAAAASRILEETLLNRPAAELAAACACFAAAGCAFAVVEAVDGALASALPAVPVCAVTHIGPDGSGRTIERLAHDAAGVMRAGAVCVTAPGQPKAALTEIIVAAGKTGCELVVPEEEDITFPDEGEGKVDYGGYDLPAAFTGYHAACNAAVAVELALALWRKGRDIPDEAILTALAAAENHSSIRVLSRQPLVILDACRTPQQAAALLRVLRLSGLQGLNAVVGLASEAGAEEFFSTLENGLLPGEAAKDKDAMPGMGEGGPIERLFLAAPPSLIGEDPGLPGRLAELARFHFEAAACGSLAEALAEARAAGGRGVLVCGSEELALAAEKLLREENSPLDTVH